VVLGGRPARLRRNSGQPVAGVGWERARVGVGVARDRFVGSVGEMKRPATGLHGSAGRRAPGARLRRALGRGKGVGGA
jgi:hypothetical protein